MPEEKEPPRYLRKVIHICAEDSPNVRLGLAQVRAGIKPTHEELVPGVLTYQQYLDRRQIWDEVRQCVGLDGKFYTGKEVMLYPSAWLARATGLDLILQGKRRRRRPRAIGVDPAEGGDKTSMTATDEWGVIDQVAKKTPNTAKINSELLAFSIALGCKPTDWGTDNNPEVVFDRGGGGKQHADRLREEGYNVRTVAFGEGTGPAPSQAGQDFEESVDSLELGFSYLNRRAQMYGEIRDWLDPMDMRRDADAPPTWNKDWGKFRGFAIPGRFRELLRQMSKIPLTYNSEGVVYIVPKSSPEGSKLPSLKKLLGCSPDELDSLVLAHHAMTHPVKTPVFSAY